VECLDEHVDKAWSKSGRSSHMLPLRIKSIGIESVSDEQVHEGDQRLPPFITVHLLRPDADYASPSGDESDGGTVYTPKKQKVADDATENDTPGNVVMGGGSSSEDNQPKAESSFMDEIMSKMGFTQDAAKSFIQRQDGAGLADCLYERLSSIAELVNADDNGILQQDANDAFGNFVRPVIHSFSPGMEQELAAEMTKRALWTCRERDYAKWQPMKKEFEDAVKAVDVAVSSLQSAQHKVKQALQLYTVKDGNSQALDNLAAAAFESIGGAVRMGDHVAEIEALTTTNDSAMQTIEEQKDKIEEQGEAIAQHEATIEGQKKAHTKALKKQKKSALRMLEKQQDEMNKVKQMLMESIAGATDDDDEEDEDEDA